MTQVFLAIGTNVDRVNNIVSAIEHLMPAGYDLVCSPVYESAAVESRAKSYFNLVVRFETSLTFDELKKYIRNIEQHLGRDRSKPEIVSIDLDILTYGDMAQKDVVPHPDIVCFRHVLQPLVDIAAEKLHPTLHTSFQKLLTQLEDPRKLSPVDEPELQGFPR